MRQQKKYRNKMSVAVSDGGVGEVFANIIRFHQEYEKSN